ncbi:hypothetical protein JOF29_008685 [Kribbella aluminosa]|uniref:DUF1700 domain-containing protein n=1 Tax=Kribbella aluminosa TaxID=416017 RepID=A0ABS4UBC3_9ACTN|nr:permease prefix domain 1-containing protein [Kribbella aluminosa]MBP2348934.1 hypothetical protein [Kribbella aluminosa]MBP2357575.1 hypothetical protein [Kribbella aluminosa]
MADRDLIHNYLNELAQRLPAGTVEELADGLEETFQHHLRSGLSPADAAHAAIAEFGPPAQVTTAFALQSPGRRTAIALLATAPVFAALWGTTLITTQAWHWPVPPAAAAVFGTTLLIVAVTLLSVARSKDPRTARLAGPASVALILLDLGMLAIATATPAVTWPMALAIAASLARTALAARNLPRVFA